MLSFSFSGNGQNQVLIFVKLKDWEERRRPEQKVKAIQSRAMGKFMEFKDAFAFAPPAALELGTATGFDVRLVDRAGLGHETLMGARDQLLGMSMQNSVVTKVRPNGLDDMPMYQLDIDQEKASALGLSLADINASMSTILGSTYVNDFIDKGRVKKVFVQGDAPFRMLPEDVNRWFLRNAQGGMVPFSAFSTTQWTLGSPKLERFNGSPSVSLLGEPAADHSSGEAMREIEQMAKRCPRALASSGPGFPTKSDSPARIRRALHHRAGHGLPLPRRAL